MYVYIQISPILWRTMRQRIPLRDARDSESMYMYIYMYIRPGFTYIRDKYTYTYVYINIHIHTYIYSVYLYETPGIQEGNACFWVHDVAPHLV